MEAGKIEDNHAFDQRHRLSATLSMRLSIVMRHRIASTDRGPSHGRILADAVGGLRTLVAIMNKKQSNGL
jgi:hypothetical protein